jgi:hypothetical protein
MGGREIEEDMTMSMATAPLRLFGFPLLVSSLTIAIKIGRAHV